MSFKNVRGLVILFVNKIMDKLFVQNNSNSSSPRHQAKLIWFLGELIFLCAWFFYGSYVHIKICKMYWYKSLWRFYFRPIFVLDHIAQTFDYRLIKIVLECFHERNLPCSVHHGSMDPFLQNVVLLINFCKVS